jgi:hypothetical protein
MAKIFPQRIGDRVFVAYEEIYCAVEPLDALFDAGRALPEVGLTLPFKNAAHFQRIVR